MTSGNFGPASNIKLNISDSKIFKKVVQTNNSL